MECVTKIPKKRGRPRLDKNIQKSKSKIEYTLDPTFTYELQGPLIASINDKKFYSSFIIDDVRISVGDCVDILIRIHKNGNRVTKLGKIASIFEQTIPFKHLFVEVSYFFDKNEGIVKSKGHKFTNWNGFSHDNEVVASNKFEYVEASAIDELINVHNDYQTYNVAVQDYEDQETNVFCKYICYTENCAIVPFQGDIEWENIMLKYSKHYHLYVKQHSNGACILGREKEIKKLKSFLEMNIRQQGTGQILYVTGVPGTGKTKTVSLVIEDMISMYKSGLPEFDVIDINATQFKDAKGIYNAIYSKLFSTPSTNYHQSLKLLDEEFSKNREKPCVLVIDEVDYLITRSQSVLFTLFNWPTYKASKIILIMISNTIDLPNRLKSSCNSRLAFGILVFTPYTGQQLNDVLNNISKQDELPVSLCAKRVANYCGDMRKAVQIYNKAKDMGQGKLTVQNVNKASNSILQSLVKKVEDLQWSYKCVLTCLVISGEEMISVRNLHRKFVGICSVVHTGIEISNFQPHYFKMVGLGLIKLVPAIFENSIHESLGSRIYPDDFTDDTGVILIPQISQIVLALSKDEFWGLKLQRNGV